MSAIINGHTSRYANSDPDWYMVGYPPPLPPRQQVRSLLPYHFLMGSAAPENSLSIVCSCFIQGMIGYTLTVDVTLLLAKTIGVNLSEPTVLIIMMTAWCCVLEEGQVYNIIITV